MSYSIAFEVLDGYIAGVVSGEITTPEAFYDKVQALVNKGLETGVYRFLMDERQLSFNIVAYDIALVANRLAADGIQIYGGRLACLYNPECREMYKVCETMYQNRSLSYRLFEDGESALGWLLR